ncbi:MAG: DUF4968 domain-containing protein, partial [Acidobacteria bacterium]|nr:DUF4968 domain-containing protein [Acidobacteriota bacterium]
MSINRRLVLRAVVLAFLCGFGDGVETLAAWRAAGNVVSVERVTDGVVVTLSSGARARVTFHDLDVVRVRLAPRGVFERDFSYAVASRDRKTVAAVVRDAGRGPVEVST